MLYPTVLRYSTVFQPIITVYAYIVKVSHDHVLLVRICNNLMHMWHHVTNHLIISNDKDSNSENRIKLHVRDTLHHSPALVAHTSVTHTTSLETAVSTTSQGFPHSLPPTAARCHYHNYSPTWLSMLTDYSLLFIAPALLCVHLRLAGRYLLNRNPTEDSD
jgi:hypothetical protein